MTATVLVTSLVIAWLAVLDVAGLRARLEGYLNIWPQQWAFFVDLDRDLLVGYRVIPDTSRLGQLSERRHSGDWSWGLGRAGYAESVELREVARRIPDQYWDACDEPVSTDCGGIRNSKQAYQAKNQAHDPTFCGQIAITVENTTLAPRQLPAQPRRVYRIAFVDLECGP